MHKNNFDGLRLFGALAVLFSHQFALSGLSEPTVLSGHSWGAIGVTIFFGISGYLVTESWKRDQNIPRFTARRLLRLWPGLAVAVLISACIVAPLVSPLSPTEFFSSQNFRRYFYILVFDIEEGNFFPSNPIHHLNGPLWTIPIEVTCYAVLGIAAVFGALKKRWIVPTALLIAVIYLHFLGGYTDIANYSRRAYFPKLPSWVAYGCIFAMGVTINNYKSELLNCRLKTAPYSIAVLIGVISIMLLKPAIFIMLVIPLFAVGIGMKSWPVLRDAGRFGDLSYGIYIYAWPVQQVIVLTLGKSTPLPILMALSLLITLLLAFASWHLVEKVALKLKPNSNQTSPSNWLRLITNLGTQRRAR